MPLRTSAIEGVLVKVTTINALAQTVNRILSVPGGHSFRQCLSTSEKSIIFSNVWINGLTHFYQCFSWARLGLDKAQFWANPFFPMFLLGWTWARCGLNHFFQCFGWARLALGKTQFWANPFFPMFLLGWTWARFGLSQFYQCFSWARLGLAQAQFWAKPFYQCVWLLGLGLWRLLCCAHVSKMRLWADLCLRV